MKYSIAYYKVYSGVQRNYSQGRWIERKQRLSLTKEKRQNKEKKTT